MYRIDHLAFRVACRKRTANFFIKTFGYKLQTEFQIKFDDNSTAECIALEPPEKLISGSPWTIVLPDEKERIEGKGLEYHRPPEYFVSDGTPDSIVGRWVQERNGIGGLHHIALQCDSVIETMNEWKQKGYAEFTTDEPLSCPDLVQVFTKPSLLTGVIFELIQRGKHGFCKDNVKHLMASTGNMK